MNQVIPQSFGRKAPAARKPLEFILVTAGAAISVQEWSLGEALHLFVTDAQQRSLFEVEEMPADAVAVFRAYELSNELSNHLVITWLGKKRPVTETIAGFRLIGRDDMADALSQAHRLWSDSEGDSDEPRGQARPPRYHAQL